MLLRWPWLCMLFFCCFSNGKTNAKDQGMKLVSQITVRGRSGFSEEYRGTSSDTIIHEHITSTACLKVGNFIHDL